MNIDKALNSRVGGYLALACVVVAGVWYINKKAGAAVSNVVAAVNPFDENNLANKYFAPAVESVGVAVTPADDANGFWDGLFGGIDLINPFNESDAYAESLVAGNYKSVQDYFDSLKMPTLSFLDYVNPASDKNVVYTGVTKVAGEQNVAKAGDYFFGALDLINPFNDDDSYAKSVWGIGSGEDSRVINNNVKEGIN